MPPPLLSDHKQLPFCQPPLQLAIIGRYLHVLVFRPSSTSTRQKGNDEEQELVSQPYGHRRPPFRHPRGGDREDRRGVHHAPRRHRQPQAIVQGLPRRDGLEGGGAVHGGAEGVAAALVGQGQVPLGAPAVRGQRQPRRLLHPRTGGNLQPEEEGERAPAPPARHGARPRRRGVHHRHDHAPRLARPRRDRAGHGISGIGWRLCTRCYPEGNRGQDRFRADRGRVGDEEADYAPLEDGWTRGSLHGPAVRGDGGVIGRLGRGRRRAEEVLQPDV